MDRFLNGVIAWLLVCLALAVVLAVAKKNKGSPENEFEVEPATTAKKTLSMVNPTPPPLSPPVRVEPAPRASAPTPTTAARHGRTINAIVVHHSESAHGDRTTIDQWHRERGWDSVGYHYVITNGISHSGQPCRDGEIQTGRNEGTVGAHARGRNQSSLGICLIGTTAFTTAQRRSLRTLLVELCRRHGIAPSSATIQRHHERCPGPGLNLEAIIEEIAADG